MRPAPESSRTQRSRILGLLISARGGWVPLQEIAACACQYGARVYELRKRGFVIVNRTEERDGTRLSWFRLIQETPAADLTSRVESAIATTSHTNSIPRESEETLPLFPEGDV
jgi:hypothetical protein